MVYNSKGALFNFQIPNYFPQRSGRIDLEHSIRPMTGQLPNWQQCDNSSFGGQCRRPSERNIFRFIRVSNNRSTARFARMRFSQPIRSKSTAISAVPENSQFSRSFDDLYRRDCCVSFKNPIIKFPNGSRSGFPLCDAKAVAPRRPSIIGTAAAAAAWIIIIQPYYRGTARFAKRTYGNRESDGERGN